MFQHFRQEKLYPVTCIIKYMVLDCNSVRLLTMANLACIHIPIELFQSSEVFLESCKTSGVKRLSENCQRLYVVNSFCKKSPLRMFN